MYYYGYTSNLYKNKCEHSTRYIMKGKIENTFGYYNYDNHHDFNKGKNIKGHSYEFNNTSTPGMSPLGNSHDFRLKTLHNSNTTMLSNSSIRS